jgi:hypothetical protein
MNKSHPSARMRWRERPFALPRRRRLQPADRNCYGLLFLFALSAFLLALSIHDVALGEFRWGHNPPSLIRPDARPCLFWGVVGFWFALGALLASVSVIGLRTYLLDRRIRRHRAPGSMNEPPVINPPTTQSRLGKLILLLAIAAIAFATVDLLLALRPSQRLHPNLTATSPQAHPGTPELEPPERNLGRTPVRLEDDEVRMTFTGLRQALDYYEAQGFIMLGTFEHSQWPAHVVHQKEATNEIRFLLKTGPPHSYPGYVGYRLRVVSLEDSAGRETVVVLRSKNKLNTE